MRIVFTAGGGFTLIPALRTPLVLDLADLPEADRRELRQLVERTAFFELPPERPGPKARDARTYTITVEDEGRAHTVTLADPVPAGDLRMLVDRLRWHAAARRSRSALIRNPEP